jgi:hypothetical protein
MRKLYYVNLEMCGGDNLPADFDLEEFCEVLQGKAGDVEIVPAVGEYEGLAHPCSTLVHPHLLNEAIGEYCHR